MGHLSNGEAAPEPDVMQLARAGDIPAMQKLFEAGDIDATYADSEGITPLHVRLGPHPPNSSIPPLCACLNHATFLLLTVGKEPSVGRYQ